mgnify:CR=1 FL=1
MQGEPQKVLGILPFLSALAIAAQRLTPPLQDLFHSLTELRGGLPQVSHTVDLLELPVERLTLGCPGVPSPAGIYPQHSIRLRDAWYRYPNTEEWVLKGVNLTIPIGSRIALVGSTGSGQPKHQQEGQQVSQHAKACPRSVGGAHVAWPPRDK